MNIVTTSPLPSGRVGTSYSTDIVVASGGDPQPLVLIFRSGTIPPGLDNTQLVKRVSQDGSFFGSPTEGENITGQTSGTVGVVYKNIATFMHYFPISGPGFTLGEQVDGSINGPLGIIDSAVTNSASYAGNPSFYPTLVPGSTYNDLTWTISGTPTTAGTYTFFVDLYDEVLNFLTGASFVITILPRRTGGGNPKASCKVLEWIRCLKKNFKKGPPDTLLMKECDTLYFYSHEKDEYYYYVLNPLLSKRKVKLL